ncbi:DinB family protein [Snuella sedimenti]|uniref:DinB family protein n=1 Tax=Snuella sedimenti TaxID=2798802 RepID=A0A8J7J395_9FLAO|nr:DinB family protein [Snuella sedimenti]MBJ6367553.1 DinB family protein [Snuella sedimenti]
MKSIEKPNSVDPELYFSPFLSIAKGVDLIESLIISKNEVIDLVDALDNSMSDHRYEEGKWTIKQVLKHICDSERVHSYRALRFSKNDKTDLPGYDENEYAKLDNTDNLSLEQIKDEFIAVRNSTIQLFMSLNPESFDYLGKGNKQELTPRIIGWKISGHSSHHCKIIKEKYLQLKHDA